jgi:hypothetical protein
MRSRLSAVIYRIASFFHAPELPSGTPNSDALRQLATLFLEAGSLLRECDETIERLELLKRLRDVVPRPAPLPMQYACTLLVASTESDCDSFATELATAHRNVELNCVVSWLPFVLDRLWLPFRSENGLILDAAPPLETSHEDYRRAEAAFGTWSPPIVTAVTLVDAGSKGQSPVDAEEDSATERNAASEQGESMATNRSTLIDGPDLDCAEADALLQREIKQQIQQIQGRVEERRQRVIKAMNVLNALLPAPMAIDQGITLSDVESVLKAFLDLCGTVRDDKFDAGVEDILSRDHPDAVVNDRTAIHLFRLAWTDQQENCRALLTRIANWPVRADGNDAKTRSQSGVWAGVRFFFDVIVPKGDGIHIWHPDWQEIQRLRNELIPREERQPPDNEDAEEKTQFIRPLVAERARRRDSSRRLSRDPDDNKQVRYCMGFDPDWWLPAMSAAKWKSPWYPIHATTESIQAWIQWIDYMCLRYYGPFAKPERAEELIAHRKSDFELIRGHAPDLYNAAIKQSETSQAREAKVFPTETEPGTLPPKRAEVCREKSKLADAPGDGRRVGTSIDRESQALALLFKEPDLSVADIADRLGVRRRTPYKWEKFRKAAELQGKLKPRGSRGQPPPSGHKSKDGQIEAYQDDEDR